MAILSYEKVMLPLLKLLSDKNEWTTRDVIEKLANDFQLSEEERKTLLPSGKL